MKFIRLMVLTALMGVPVFFSSCKKTTNIGSNVLPASDFLNAVSTDTVTCWVQVQPELPVQTNSQSNYLLGSMTDPVFGKSYAAIFTQVALPGYVDNFTLPDSMRIDSAVLALPYYTSVPLYGVIKSPQTVKVYRVTQNLAPGVTYYSNQSFSYDPTPIGSKNNFIPDFVDSVTLPYDTAIHLAPQLRIKLSNDFIQSLLSQSATGVFTSNSTFQNYLKGLLIAPDTSNGYGQNIMYFDMTNAYIYLYGKIGNNNTETLVDYFSINSSLSVATDYYKHNYNNTPIQTVLKSNAVNDSVLYLQSMGGLRAKITLPYIKNLGKILVDKATFQLTQLYDNPSLIDTSFKAPGGMQILTDSANINYTIEDIDNPFLSYGGTRSYTLNNSGDSVATYNINVADQLQYVLTGNPTHSTVNYSSFPNLFLRTFPNPEIADRIVVGGSNASKYKLVLHLVYTKIN